MIILKILVYIGLDILPRPIITHNNGLWNGFGISLGAIVMAKAKRLGLYGFPIIIKPIRSYCYK